MCGFAHAVGCFSPAGHCPFPPAGQFPPFPESALSSPPTPDYIFLGSRTRDIYSLAIHQVTSACNNISLPSAVIMASGFGTPNRGKPRSPGRNFGKNSHPSTPVSGKSRQGGGTSPGGTNNEDLDSKLRPQAPPFFMSGSELKAVVPLAGYFPGPNPYQYSPYHNSPKAGGGDGENLIGVGAGLPAKDLLPKFPIPNGTTKETRVSAPPAQKKEEVDEKGAQVSEEDWARRIAKRKQDVAKMKGLRFYRNFIDKVPKPEDRAEDDPVTPRAEDRGLSKRGWKALFDDWVYTLGKKYDGRIHQRSELLKRRGEKGDRPEVLRISTMKTETTGKKADLKKKA